MDQTTIALDIHHIVSTPHIVGGKPRIAGTRISVSHVADQHLNYGASIQELEEMYDLTSGQIYAALSYYFDHRAEIDAIIEEERRYEEEHRPKE